MSTSNQFKSDLYSLYNVTQSSVMLYPKEIILATLKDFFSKDSYYHYSKDEYGFANTTDHTDLPLGSDLPVGSLNSTSLTNINLPTRLFIGENYRKDIIFYPAILVKNSGGRSVQVSFTRQKGTVQYEDTLFIDGYGNEKIISTPSTFVTAGAFEGTINIDVRSRSIRARDDLVDLIFLCFTDFYFEDLIDVGLTIKPITIGSTNELEDRNDKLFVQSLNLEYRMEWRREIPIKNIIERILFIIDVGNTNNPSAIYPPELKIETDINLVDNII